MVLVNGGYLHCTDKEILVNSSLKGKKKKEKMARLISKTQVSDPGPSWPSCLISNDKYSLIKKLTDFLYFM